MDRRRFLKAAGLAGVGVGLGGCGEAYLKISIPCVAVADVPMVPGMTYIRASEIGCALDCDLTSGRNRFTGGEATDDGPRINAAMAAASVGNPLTLVIDGPASISGLFLPAGGNWSIIGQGCQTGFFIRTGTNNDGIHNGGPTANQPVDPGPPAPTTRGANVTLANFVVNGNQGNGFDGDSTTGSTQGITATTPNVWNFSINLMNLDYITVTNVVVVNSPAYHFRFSNCGQVTITGCVLQSSGPSTDGLHFDGPANDITISNCQFTTDDDAIALNCPEGFCGNIENVTVTDCTFSSWTLMRMDTINSNGNYRRYMIRNVQVSRCSGQMQLAAFLLGQGAGALPESISGFTVSDCTLTAPAVLEIGANFGAVELNNVRFTPAGSQQTPGYAIARTSPFFYDCTYAGTSLTLTNCLIVRTSGVDVAALIVEYGSSIANFEVDGLAVNDGYPAAAAMANLANGTLGQLTIDAVTSARIAAPVSGAGFAAVGEVTGTGLAVLNSGWEFPDWVMADGVPYISAETGIASIEVNGVVEPFS